MKTVDIYHPLQKPNELNLEAAKETYGFLKDTMIPYIYKHLKELYLEEPRSQITFARIFELEVRLAELREYQDKLLSVFGQENLLIPAHLRVADLQNIETDGCSFIHCTANLFLSPISKDFAHGPILAYYVFTAAEIILSDNERVNELVSIYWKKLTQNNITLHVQENPSSDSETRHLCPIRGVLVTNKQRKLYFWSKEITSSLITEESSRNEVVLNLMKECQLDFDKTNSQYTWIFNRSNLIRYRNKLNGSVPFAAYTLLDLLSQCILQLYNFGKNQTLLFCNARNLIIPNKFENELILRIILQEDKTRSLSSGFDLVQGYFKYLPYQSTYSSGLFAKSIANNKITKYLRS